MSYTHLGLEDKEMLELFMIMSLSPVLQPYIALNDTPDTVPPTGIMTAAVKPCVWPNRCGGSDDSIIG